MLDCKVVSAFSLAVASEETALVLFDTSVAKFVVNTPSAAVALAVSALIAEVEAVERLLIVVDKELSAL